MLLFNGTNTAFPNTLLPPSLAFDPDLRKFKITSKDFRDTPVISYSINNGEYLPIESGVLKDYTLLLDNFEYNIDIKIEPSNPKYKTEIHKEKIFVNDVLCKYFLFDTSTYYTNKVVGYIGTDPNIVIPTKHNLTNITTASILSLENVDTNAEISVKTPIYMTSFYIKDNRITKFDILNSNFIPAENQFSNMTNLKEVNFSTKLTTVPDYCFSNCPNLEFPDDEFVNASTFGFRSFYDTPKLKVIRFSGSNLSEGVFDYSSTGVEKVIFTSKDSINGLTNKTLPTGTFTGGMLYNGNKKHQVFCNVSSAVWPDEPETTPRLTFSGYDKNTGYLKFQTSTKIIGLELKAESKNGEEKGFVYLIPSTSNATTTTPGFTINGNTKTFTLYYTYLYGLNVIYNTDIITVRLITSTGFMDGSYSFSAEGAPQETPENNSGLILHAVGFGGTIRLPWVVYSGKFLLFFSGYSSPAIGIFDSDGNDVTSKALKRPLTVQNETVYGGTQIYKIDLASGAMYNSYLNSSQYYIRLAQSTANLTKDGYYISAQMQKSYSIY